MSKQLKPVRQDFLAKVRYINSLPPPPLNPKLLKYNLTDGVDEAKESEYLLSSLFRKENFHNLISQVDEEFGMPLNLLHNRGFLDGSNTKAIFSNNHTSLHSSDRALLRDAGIGNVNKSEPGVSFLRRTEYIAEKAVHSKGEEAEAATASTKKSELLDPDAQLRAVEETFDQAQESLENFAKLRHPRKKHLKAVNAFPLLPDTSTMDTKFLSVKFTGSASFNREIQQLKRQQKAAYDEDLQKLALLSSILKPITSEDGEWVSFYQLKDKAEATELYGKLNSSSREQPLSLLDEEEQDVPSYKFRHFKTYDMVYQGHEKPYDEISVKLPAPEGESKKRRAALYLPITGRVELKKHRASTNSEINKFISDSTADVIEFKLREPNTSELRKMDNARSEYDPMEYEAEEDEEEEEDVEAAGEVAEQEEEQQDAETDLATEEGSKAKLESVENKGDGSAKMLENERDVADEFDRAAETEGL